MRTVQELTADQPVGEHGQHALHPARRWVPWRGRASRIDRALIAAMLVVVAIGLVLRPMHGGARSWRHRR